MRCWTQLTHDLHHIPHNGIARGQCIIIFIPMRLLLRLSGSYFARETWKKLNETNVKWTIECEMNKRNGQIGSGRRHYDAKLKKIIFWHYRPLVLSIFLFPHQKFNFWPILIKLDNFIPFRGWAPVKGIYPSSEEIGDGNRRRSWPRSEKYSGLSQRPQ